MHGNGDGEGAGGDQVVDDGGDGVEADVGVIALAGQLEHGVGDEVFGAETFFDVGEVAVVGFEEVGAFAADGGWFFEVVGGEGRNGGGGGVLAEALEGVEGVVADAGLVVGEVGH